MVKYQSPYNETITKLKMKTLWVKLEMNRLMQCQHKTKGITWAFKIYNPYHIIVEASFSVGSNYVYNIRTFD